MAHIEQQQLEDNRRPPNLFPLSTPPQRQNRVLHDAVIPSVTGPGQLQVQWEDGPTIVGNSTAQGTLWDPHHSNVVNYGTAGYPELAGDLSSPYTRPNVGPAHQQGIPEGPEHVQVRFHENTGNDCFGREPNGVIPGPTQAAFSNSSTHLAADVGQPAAENLRRLASRYIYDPDSQVDMVRMEPGSAGRYKVVIVLEMADFP